MENILIIGAGTAGLALSAELKKKEIDHLIIESSSSVGSTWKQMPDHLKLITFWRSNYLREDRKNDFPANKVLSAVEYQKTLEHFSETNKLPIKFNSPVITVHLKENHFEVQSKNKIIKCKKIVNCTGYFSSPFIPKYKGQDTSELKSLHFKDFKNIEQVNSLLDNMSGNILVVGKRLSAGQIISELSKTGHGLYLSSRGKVSSSLPPLLFNYFLTLLDRIEKVVLLCSKNIKATPDVKMDYQAAKLIDKKRVISKPDIKEIRENSVVFDDSTEQKIDLIIYATGFIPHLPHLAEIEPNPTHLRNDFESEKIEGLFFLGLESQRNFRSRFIRGIREDAIILARQLSKK